MKTKINNLLIDKTLYRYLLKLGGICLCFLYYMVFFLALTFYLNKPRDFVAVILLFYFGYACVVLFLLNGFILKRVFSRQVVKTINIMEELSIFLLLVSTLLNTTTLAYLTDKFMGMILFVGNFGLYKDLY